MKNRDANKPPTSEIGKRIYAARTKEGLTQDQYGRRFEVSGPAIFKFEKGKVNPSYSLWMKMAEDSGISEHHAALLWVREKLPPENGHLVDVPLLLNEFAEKYEGKKITNYAKVREARELRRMVKKDKDLPQGLQELLEEDELWRLFKPTGKEIEEVRNRFASIGYGSREDYREALRIVRAFLRN